MKYPINAVASLLCLLAGHAQCTHPAPDASGAHGRSATPRNSSDCPATGARDQEVVPSDYRERRFAVPCSSAEQNYLQLRRGDVHEVATMPYMWEITETSTATTGDDSSPSIAAPAQPRIFCEGSRCYVAPSGEFDSFWTPGFLAGLAPAQDDISRDPSSSSPAHDIP